MGPPPSGQTFNGYFSAGRLWALEWTWKTFLGQSIGIDQTNTFQLQFLL